MHPTSLTLILVCAIAPFSLTGCGNGQDRNTATIKATAPVPDNVAQSRRDLDQVQSSLKRIRDAANGDDLKKLYKELQSRSSDLNSSLAEVQSSSESAVKAGKDQITEWHKQADTFTDADLRNSSNKREGDLRTAVDSLSAANATLGGASSTYRSELSQTQKALDLDLTQSGIQTVAPVIAKLVDDEPHLRDALTDVQEKTNAVTAIIHPKAR